MELRRIILLSLLILLQVSCYREETIVLPVCENCTKPVVLCFISPGDSIKAYVTFTTAFGKVPQTASNEMVTAISISDTAGNSINLVNSKNNLNSYVASQANFKIIAGKLYTLRLYGKDGIISTASTKVPAVADYWNSATLIGTQVEDDATSYLTKLEWTKVNSVKNIIEFGSLSDSTRLIGQSIFDFKESELGNSKYSYVYSEYWRGCYLFTLYTINESVEKYMKNLSVFNDIGWALQETTVDGIYNGTIPEYTNFDNGLGVFGAYLTDTISVINTTSKP